MDTPPSSPTQSELAITLRELAWTVHRRAPERAGVGPIPTTELVLLKQVMETPGATVGELSQTLGLHQPNTSAAIRILVQRGLVARETSDEDRRVSKIVPTELAATEHGAIAEEWAGSVDAALENLSVEHKVALNRALDALQALDRALRDR
ncbi:MarR family winged helix-turn-helix transcriptional regulator [Subtercola sp. YIM 133946]|uniref:MarR family winged helix-turn-helix transcriptional regulator n=1 Tax=Subtercola sp. YIM 133946 TaxID=3118909 RepID=UPI002F95DA37